MAWPGLRRRSTRATSPAFGYGTRLAVSVEKTVQRCAEVVGVAAGGVQQFGQALDHNAVVQRIGEAALINLANPNSNSSSASKAGKVLPGYGELMESARKARSTGRVLFPLSSVHTAEVSRIAGPRQRSDIAAVMEALSDFTYLLGRPTLGWLEIDAGLDSVYGETIGVEDYLPLLGSSFGWRSIGG